MKQSDTGVKEVDININCLLYADDAVLVVSTERELQASVTTLKEECENNGLGVNESKKGWNARSV